MIDIKGVQPAKLEGMTRDFNAGRHDGSGSSHGTGQAMVALSLLAVARVDERPGRAVVSISLG